MSERITLSIPSTTTAHGIHVDTNLSVSLHSMESPFHETNHIPGITKMVDRTMIAAMVKQDHLLGWVPVWMLDLGI